MFGVFGESVFTYDVEVDESTVVLWALEQGTDLSGHGVPGAMEVVGHNVDHIQGPAQAKKA